MARRDRYVFGTEEPRWSRRIFLWLLAFVFLAALGLGVYNFGLSNQVTYVRQSVTVPGLSGDLENWTILHISDLHGRYISQNHAAILSALGNRTCSSIVFTGDMVGADGDVQPLLDLVALLPESVPKMYLPGDSDPPLTVSTAHSTLSVYAPWAEALREAGVIILDEPVSFTRNKSTIWFIPEELYSLDVDSTEAVYQAQIDRLNASQTALTPDEAAQKRLAEYQVARMQRLRETRRTIKEKDIQIAVSHAPMTAEYARAMMQAKGKDQLRLQNVALVLAGHYCGGQWRLPGIGAVYVPELGTFPSDELIQGMNYLDGLPQYISPGLSYSDFYPMPGRLFNQPVITMIALTANIN